MSVLTATTADSTLVMVYRYYSYFTLFISLTLAPVVFYVIITQSKDIGYFKWLILNNSFWCLCLEVLVGVIKPVLLTPVYAGYQAGLFAEITSYRSSAVSIVLIAFCSITAVCGMVITIFSRYMVIFPSKWQSLYNRKEVYILFCLIYIGIAICFFIASKSLFELSSKDLYDDAREFDKELEVFFDHLTWFYVDAARFHTIMLGGVIGSSLINVGFVTVIVFFFYQMRVNHKAHFVSNKLQKSLIVNTLFHCAITAGLLMMPLYAVMVFLCFEIQNTAQIMVGFMCVLSTHCLAEFISTLIIIRPYNIWIKKQLLKFSPASRVVPARFLAFSSTNH